MTLEEINKSFNYILSSIKAKDEAIEVARNTITSLRQQLDYWRGIGEWDGSDDPLAFVIAENAQLKERIAELEELLHQPSHVKNWPS